MATLDPPRFQPEDDSKVPDLRYPAGTDPYLRDLRSRFRLDEVVKGTTDDLSVARALRTWISCRWKHSNDEDPSKDDPMTILEEASKGHRFHCPQYALALAGCLGAFGLPSRTVSVMAFDVETRPSSASHVVTEAWLPSLGKWVMLDGQEDATVSVGGPPLSAYEILLRRSDPALSVEVENPAWRKSAPKYVDFFFGEASFLQTLVDNASWGRVRNAPSVMLVPLGASEPKAFQVTTPFKNVIYTRSASAFYRPPKP